MLLHCTYMYMYTSLPVQELHSSSSGEHPLEMGEGSERVLPSISSYPTVTDTTKREGSCYSKRTDYQIHQLSLYLRDVCELCIACFRVKMCGF